MPRSRRPPRSNALACVAVAALVSSLATTAGAHSGRAVDAVVCAAPAPVGDWPAGFLNFETPQCNPIALSRRGRLYAVDTPRHRVLELDRRGRVRRSLAVGLEPAGVAVSPDARTLYVTNHLSDSVSVVDVRKWTVVHVIQDIDPATRLARLDEPCGVAFSPSRAEAYVTLSQPNRLAVIDTTSHAVAATLDLPGEDPRAVAVAPDGRFVFVAPFESGNRTEVELAGQEDLYQSGPGWFAAFLFFVESSLGVGDARIEELLPGPLGPTVPDDDLFVVDTDTLGVTAIRSLGTLLYALAPTADGTGVWVANTEHRNTRNGPTELAGRPIVNRITRVSTTGGTWNDAKIAHVPVDQDASGAAIPGGAVPAAVAIAKRGEILVAASGSDRLIIADATGGVRARVPVGSMPRGIATRGNRAYVYNRGDMSLSVVDLRRAAEILRAPLSTDPLPADLAAGRRLFHAARFSANGTFSCASCHPDAHVDQLVWDLGDGPRTTMTMRGLRGTEKFHWDGTRDDALDIVVEGVTGPVFGGAIDGCEADLMARYILAVDFPPSPHRAPTDTLGDDARVGAVAFRRGVVMDASHVAKIPLELDPAFASLLRSVGGATITPNLTEACATSGCHTAPLWTRDAPAGQIQPVTTRGLWDRNAWLHNGISSKIMNLEATDEALLFLGHAAAYAGVPTARAASAAFMTTFFRHLDPGVVDPIALNFTHEAFLRELSTGVPGALGRQVLYDGSPGPGEAEALVEIIAAAAAEKVAMRLDGRVGKAMVGWTWLPATNEYAAADGALLSADEVAALLVANPHQLQVTAHLPANTAVRPLLDAIVLESSPGELANAINGERQVFVFRGSGFAPGLWVLVDGWRYRQAEVLDATTARLVEDPVSAAGPYYVVSVQNPGGLASNEFPVPVLGPPAPGPAPTFRPAALPGSPLP
jgi:YVTN family beta-propeller protein